MGSLAGSTRLMLSCGLIGAAARGRRGLRRGQRILLGGQVSEDSVDGGDLA